MATAFIFPGQGSQTIGMGKDLYNNFKEAKAVFQEVDEALNQSLSRLMFEGDIAELTQTENAQPAIMAVSLAVVRVLESELGKSISDLADCVAGHSLGEYSALCAAGALGISDTARLLRARGLAMKEAGDKHPGGMAAILGLDMATVNLITKEASTETGLCVLANDNCPGQVVISGDLEAINRAVQKASDKGARKALKLPVSGAFHSPLMKSASEKMRSILEGISIDRPQIPVVANITAEYEQDPFKIKELLISQVTGSVRWTESVQYMASKGVTDFIECGNGKVLSGLVKRIVPEARAINLSDCAGITEGISIFK